MDLINAISLIVGFIGTGLAIYQTAVLNESKKRKGELQFLLAGISGSALQKQQLWANQISLLKNPESDNDMVVFRMHVRARDDFADIANLTVALEGVIDTENSAIKAMMDKALETVRQNNAIQIEGLKNPTIEQKQGE